MQDINPYMIFRQEAPQAADAFDGLIGAVRALGGLDDKTRQIIYIGIKASQGDAAAVAAHAPMAKQAGATREEVRDAVMLTLITSGVSGVVKCLPAELMAFENRVEEADGK